MKFISRSSNYMLVLKPGIPGNHLTGQASVPGLYIRFRDGVVETKDESVINMMKLSDGFHNGEFIAVDETGEDPFAESRTPTEPTHIISELKYGHVEGRKVSDVPTKIPASVKKLIEAEAKKMAKKMLPDLLREAVKELAEEQAQMQSKAVKSTHPVAVEAAE